MHSVLGTMNLRHGIIILRKQEIVCYSTEHADSLITASKSSVWGVGHGRLWRGWQERERFKWVKVAYFSFSLRVKMNKHLWSAVIQLAIHLLYIPGVTLSLCYCWSAAETNDGNEDEEKLEKTNVSWKHNSLPTPNKIMFFCCIFSSAVLPMLVFRLIINFLKWADLEEVELIHLLFFLPTLRVFLFYFVQSGCQHMTTHL